MSWNMLCNSGVIPREYHNVMIDDLSIHVDDQLEDFSVKARKWFDNPSSLLLLGKAGRGKTYFMYVLIRGAVTWFGLDACKFIKSKDLDDSILKALSDYGSSAYTISQLIEPQFLFIDDLGVERATDRAQRDYYDIIDKRFADHKITVISTNLKLNEIRETYGERISSRLQLSSPIFFDGLDLRNSNNRSQHVHV